MLTANIDVPTRTALRPASYVSAFAKCVDHEFEVLWAAGVSDGFVVVDFVFLDQFEEGLVEGLHAVVFAFGDGLFDLAGLVRVHDEVLDASRGDHHFAGRGPAPVSGADQALSDDALERAGQHGAHLAALVRREEVYQAVYGLGGVKRMESRE